MSQSTLPQDVSRNSPPRRTRFSNTKRHPAAQEPTLAEQNELLITRALAIVEEQKEASKVLREVEQLRAENKRLAAVELEHASLLEAFTQPTDDTSAHAGILRYVAHDLLVVGWAHSDTGGNASFEIADHQGHDAARRFRFLSALVTIAARWSDEQCAHAAGGSK